MYPKTRRMLESLALGLLIAAVTAPAGFGEPRGAGNPLTGAAIQQSVSPDDRPYYRGADWSAQAEPRIVSPDDRSLSRATESPNPLVSESLSPDDRALPRGAVSASAPMSVTSSASDDFQWDDAGLGAASTLALVLMLGAAAFLIRNQRRRITAF